MEVQWHSREEKAKNELVDQGLSDSLGELSAAEYPPLIRRLLFSRGFRDDSLVQKWLAPKLAELKDPFSMQDMRKGVDRLVEAFRNKEKVCVYADFDLDGTSGLALLNDGLKQLGYQSLRLAQPKRLSEGYGFHSHIVEDLKSEGVSVIITVDVGITAFEACEKARSLGVDVVLTDHHQPADSLPPAFAVINPNRRDDESKLGFLCGAGVAFYFLRALKRGLVEAGLISPSTLDLKSVLDCFCIGTLTDMVPLIDDNRALVKQGLLMLEQTRRPGLRALLESLDLSNRSLSSQDVAIRFAPKLNALSRMEMGILPIDIFLIEDRAEAQKMVKTVLENNSTRVQLQGAGEDEAFEKLRQWPHDQFVFLASQNFHKGVVGLIATKISLAKNVPTFIGAINAEGVITGSARLPQGRADSLLEALESAKAHLVRFGGHDAAAGFELKEGNFDQVLKAFQTHYETQKPATSKSFHYDLEARLEEVNESLMRWFDILGPFGQSFETPVLCFRNVQIDDVLVLKAKHLKMKLVDPESKRRIESLYFSAPPDVLQNLPARGSKVDVIGEVQWNYFSGRRTLQLLIKDFKIAKMDS